jgi:hypothetical protein
VDLTNTIYNEARRRLATAALNWPVVDLVLIAWTGPPTFYANDKVISDVAAHGAVLAAYSQTIVHKAVALDGTAQTDQVLLPMVPIGPTITYFTMCQRHATVPEQSQLILFIDEAENLPFVPNGLDIVVEPDWLENRGWFRA